jgi:aryl-alcohol dehydrogenase-like predicted oxidoreductase
VNHISCGRAGENIQEMKYRILGRTGLKVSELGLGGHEYERIPSAAHFTGKRKFEEPVGLEELLETQGPRNELIKRAIDVGVNFFDTGQIEEPQSLGLALESLGQRKDVYIAAEAMSPVRRLKEIPRARWKEDVIEGVEGRMKLLRTKYIDVYNIHMPESDYSRDRFEAVIEVLKEVKEQGKIGAIGAASHQPRFLAKLIRKYDCFDSVMVPYNYHLQEARNALFPLCKAFEVGVVIMKPFCWPYYGISFNNFCPPNLETGGNTPNQISLKWILRSPEVSTIVPGTNTITELEENLVAITKEGKVDEGVLKRCLELAQSHKGKEKLRELIGQEEIERTRVYIRGYAQRALAEVS